MSTQLSQSNLEAVLETLPTKAREVIRAARLELSHFPTASFYLVGGAVRDALLGVSVKDVDTVIEGVEAKVLAQRLEPLDITSTCYEDFMTCTLYRAGEAILDIATARAETYAHPGALPQVTPSDITQDLARRDFSLNALALRLSPEPVIWIDDFNGVRDLEKRELSVLHPRSFTEDPTRLLRGARLAGRLGLEFAPDTAALIPAALEPEILNQISAARLKHELELSFREKPVLGVLEHLEKHTVLAKMFGLSLDKELIASLDNLKVVPEAYRLAVLLSLKPDEVTPWLERFGYSLKFAESVARLRDVRSLGTLSVEQFKRSSASERMVIAALSQDLAARLNELTARTKERGLSGADVIGLGLPEGPQVGQILRQVAEAQDAGTVTSFEQALALARTLVNLDR